MTRIFARLVAFALLFLTSIASADDDKEDKETGPVRGAPPSVTAPVEGHPIRLLSVPEGGVYAQMPDNTIVELATGDVALKMKEKNASIGTTFCAAAAGPRFYCLYNTTGKSSSSGSSGPRSLVLVSSEGDHEVLGSGSGDHYSITALGLFATSDGEVALAYSETDKEGQAVVTHQYLVRGDDKAEISLDLGSVVSQLANIGAGDRVDPAVHFVEIKGKLWMVHRLDGTLVAHPAKPSYGEPIEVAGASLHDVRVVRGEDDFIYVFYHDPSSSTARVSVSEDGKTWKDMPIDGRESGWQLEAIPTKDGVVTVFYYFRNSYNKGLRSAIFKDGARTEPVRTLVREHAFNTGWHPLLGVGADGRIWLSYLANVEEKTRAWSTFPGARHLTRFEVAGGKGWEEDYKDYFLQTGAGVWLTFWDLHDGVPDDVGVALDSTGYSVNMAVLVSANLEARYGSFDAGLSYAQAVVDDAVKDAGDNAGVLNGSLKIDELLPGHDIKLAFLWGRYNGVATAGTGVAGRSAKLSTNYVDVQLLALNKWRIKYGLGFTTYRAPTSVHAFTAPIGQSAYRYEGSVLRDVEYKDIDLVLGYSKLDYAAKYENHYNDWILDGYLAGGLTLTNFDPIPTSLGTVEDGLTFNFRVVAQLGWLYFHRFESLRGLGFYLRPAYQGEIAFTGSASSPSPRESDKTDKDSLLGNLSLRQIRHGPWFDLGIVW